MTNEQIAQVYFEVMGQTLREQDAKAVERVARGIIEAYVKQQKAVVSQSSQPLIKDERGVVRFKENALVVALWEHGDKTGLGTAELDQRDFPKEDRQQLAQLVGYSLQGYHRLSYAPEVEPKLEPGVGAEKSAEGLAFEVKALLQTLDNYDGNPVPINKNSGMVHALRSELSSYYQGSVGSDENKGAADPIVTVIQYRGSPQRQPDEVRWSEWEECSLEEAAAYESIGPTSDWQYQVRRLYSSAPQVSKDAERYKWLSNYLAGGGTSLNQSLLPVSSVEGLNAIIDAAILARGLKRDRF